MHRVGEPAQHAGVTVRTLHHYDELGLLTPSERTGGGHRLDGADDPERLLEVLEAMSMFEKYYTPEQLQQLEERRRTRGDEEIKRVEDEWRDLYAQVHEHRTNGTDPSDPAVQALVTRSGELIQMFTGGDPEIAASLKRMYEQEGPQRASRGVADPEDLAYLETACPTRS